MLSKIFTLDIIIKIHYFGTLMYQIMSLSYKKVFLLFQAVHIIKNQNAYFLILGLISFLLHKYYLFLSVMYSF